MQEEFAYSDIVALPHHVSDRRPQMPRKNRAAQFAPFAALSGYEEEIAEEARLTQSRRNLTEEEREILADRLTLLCRLCPTQQSVTFTWFVPDLRKNGGEYRTDSGIVVHICDRTRQIVLKDGTFIPVDAVDQIESDLFYRNEDAESNCV